MQISSFQVVPALPEKLLGLREMAYNLLWSWDDEIRIVFSRLDRDLWSQTYQNPVLMLGLISQDRLNAAAKDDGFMAFYSRTYERFKEYLHETTWWDQRHMERPLIAYFSAEFGLTECLANYSGGLGVLSGHHLKSASDLGFPLVGVGLLYQQGYFRQYLASDGWQQESYPTNDFYNLPVQPALDDKGAPARVELDLAGQRLFVKIWRAEVGRLPLLLLDTNLPENPPDLQDITDQLYGGDQENRIRQEIVLGMGGMKALVALGYAPAVCHMNEGHSAFLSLERMRMLIKEHGVRFHEALEAARAGNVFTSHTPVPAGFDVFSEDLMDKYFSAYMHEVGVSRDDLLALGRPPNDPSGPFNMATLAIGTSAFANGVSRLHGEVARSLFQPLFPAIPESEIPVTHVTNGAHTRSCVSREMAELFDRYLGPEWWRRPGQPATWEGVDTIPDEELWSTHERRRERLVAFARQRLMRQMEQRGASARDVQKARGVLNTHSLTIGFARRFATYKRADLILTDVERLIRILTDPKRPVQIIFAGKAHPKDTPGKEMLKAIVSFCQRDDMRRHAVFLEDYDIVVARYLVQGVDIWLNTPRRGLEASGTSGMKVLPNGGLNLSILDGWWSEAYQPEVGWAIGKGEDYQDHSYQDYVESNSIYDLLEKDIVPLFYQRGIDGLPRPWIARIKKSMKLTPTFSSNRMLWEYGERFYLPSAHCFESLTAERLQRARKLAEWKTFIRQQWGGVRIEKAEAQSHGIRRVGEGFEVRAVVRLGPISPEDVYVELYFGSLDAQRRITAGQAIAMRMESALDGGIYRYSGAIPCDLTGMIGYSVRMRPCHPDANNLLCTGLMNWL
ncbi:MAG: alpha-glucan family phosphorylase [Vicinamibacteria bacterium]|nr:alpha-glucan family phosphorylase [Vicinamibacteria bacterium]